MTDASRVIVVTGAARGIGRAIAVALAEPGTFIYLNDLRWDDEAQKVIPQIQALGGQAAPLPFDISNLEAISEGFEKIAQEQGGVDVLVNNAGISMDALTLRAKDDEWQKTMDINLRGAFACSRAALKTMLKRKNQGRIIMMASVVGQMGNAGQAIYGASKAGLIGLTKSIAREVAIRQVTVNAVAPGFVKTAMTDSLTPEQKEVFLKNIPLGRWAEPEDIASVVRFLASKEASYITGQVIAVNGGMYL